jgi:threonine/homoserine/homoserine lactone efflux protein
MAHRRATQTVWPRPQRDLSFNPHDLRRQARSNGPTQQLGNSGVLRVSIDIWLTFVAASVVLLIIPGPTILTVISYSMAHGRRANVPLVAAVALGDSTALLVSLLGLGALLATSAFWFTAVKWAGGLYLLYLGTRLLRAGISPIALAAPAQPGSRWRLFANTYLVTALNPKGIVFFVAFLPQFIRPDASVTQQLWVLAATFVFLATLNATLYAVFAASARKLLASARAQRSFNLAGGLLLCAAGVWALLVKRPA